MNLNMNVAPAWLGHRPADFDGMGLADCGIPGFLFIVGMASFCIFKEILIGSILSTISAGILSPGL